MKIREGAYYRTRHGDVVGPMRRSKGQIWYSSYRTWNEDGSVFSSGAAHGLDLISEVYVSDTPLDEPTRAMLDAARDWSLAKYHQAIGDDAAAGCYRAMRAAAGEAKS